MPRRAGGHENDTEQRRRDVLTVVERLAANVRRTRMAAGISQERLAELAGIDSSYVQRVERGAPANITIAVVGALARALSVDVASLFRLAKAEPRPVGRPALAANPTRRQRKRG